MTDPATTHDRPRQLRDAQTDPERKPWDRLRNRRLSSMKFRRQHPIGPFVVDFCCIERRLVIELDGIQHEVQEPEDADRTGFIESRGFKVVRFWNDDVLDDVELVLDRILEVARAQTIRKQMTLT